MVLEDRVTSLITNARRAHVVRESRGPVPTWRRIALVLLAVFASVVLAACGGGSEATPDATPGADDTKKAQVGGTIVFALEDEPASLNAYSSQGFSAQTTIISGPVLGQFTVLTPEGDYEPQLLADDPELVSEDPQKVAYKLHPDAVWDDGTPVTATDVQYTLDQILAPGNDILDRRGYTLIAGGKLSDISGDGKEFTFEFTQPYAPWQRLFSVGQPVLKAAALGGSDFNTALNDGIGFASGPFKLASWTKGDSAVLVRNEAYWGEHKSYLDSVTFKFLASAELMSQALAAGTVDVVYEITEPQVATSLREIPGVDVQITAGPIWEHIDFNTRDPLLQLTEVREAVVRAIDREQIVDATIRPIDGDAVVLQNIFYMNNQAGYVENWDTYVRDTTKVDELLTNAGFTKGPDGIYSRGDVRLTLTLLTTEGNPLRAKTGEVLAGQLADAGIELVIEAVPTATLLDRVANCEYQVAMFAYQADPDPSTANAIYRDDSITCPGENQNIDGQNSTAYSDREVTELLNRTDAQLDPDLRVRLYQEVDKLIAQDIPTLPLYQRSTVLAYISALREVKGNATLQGPTWNLGDWWLDRPASPSPAPAPATSEPGPGGSAPPAEATPAG